MGACSSKKTDTQSNTTEDKQQTESKLPSTGYNLNYKSHIKFFSCQHSLPNCLPFYVKEIFDGESKSPTQPDGATTKYTLLFYNFLLFLF